MKLGSNFVVSDFAALMKEATPTTSL